MDLIALRYIFEGEKGRESFGKPKVGITPLRVSEKEHGQFVAEQNGYWEIKTHDRGEDTGKPSFAYFQIAFRLEGTEKEKGGGGKKGEERGRKRGRRKREEERGRGVGCGGRGIGGAPPGQPK